MAEVATKKNADLGEEDKKRKEKMVEELLARDMLSESAESFIRSGIR